MTRNVGNTDRIVRFLLGIVLVVVALLTQNVLIGVLSLIPFATAAINFCPLYALFGINTCAVKR